MRKPGLHEFGSLATIAALLALAGCGSQEAEKPKENPGTTAERPIATEGSQAAALAQCRTCHTFAEGEPHRVGPNLWNAVGNPAASKPGYQYSTALAASGLVWDEDTLHAYLENPRKLVPGGKMSYAGMRDRARRDAVIAYMRESSKPSE